MYDEAKARKEYWVTILNRVVRGGSTEKMTFE